MTNITYNNKQKSNRSKAGFTLIEIVIALAIVSGLALIGFGAFRYLGRAKVTQTRTNIQAVHSAIKQYVFENNNYPKDLQDLVSSGYLGEDDILDAWGEPLVYEFKGKKVKPPYVLESAGDPQDPNAQPIRLETRARAE